MPIMCRIQNYIEQNIHSAYTYTNTATAHIICLLTMRRSILFAFCAIVALIAVTSLDQTDAIIRAEGIEVSPLLSNFISLRQNWIRPNNFRNNFFPLELSSDQIHNLSVFRLDREFCLRLARIQIQLPVKSNHAHSIFI